MSGGDRTPVKWAEGTETLGWNAVECLVTVVELSDGRVVRQELPTGSQTYRAWRVVEMPFDKAAKGLTKIDPTQRAFWGRVIRPRRFRGV